MTNTSLIIGGPIVPQDQTSKTHFFNFQTDTFLPAIDLPEAKLLHNLVQLTDIKVLMVGGTVWIGGTSTANENTFLYDISKGTWTTG